MNHAESLPAAYNTLHSETPELAILETFLQESPLPEPPEIPVPESKVVAEGPTLTQRLWRSRLGRATLACLTAAGLVAVGLEAASDEEPAHAETGMTFTVTGTDGDGVWLHGIAGFQGNSDLIKVMPEGTQFHADCYVLSDPVGAKGNPVWLHGNDGIDTGFFTDSFSNSTWSHENTLKDQGLAVCGEGASAPVVREPEKADGFKDVKSCYWNLKAPSRDLTFYYEGDHRYYGNAWQAAKNWTDTNVGITIRPWKPGDSNPYIVIKDVYYTDRKDYARTEVPDRDPDWIEGRRDVPTNPHIVSSIVILANQYMMDTQDDFHRTYTLGHEMGHTLGLAHSDACSDNNQDESLMHSGRNEDANKKAYNTPREYEKNALRKLYATVTN